MIFSVRKGLEGGPKGEYQVGIWPRRDRAIRVRASRSAGARNMKKGVFWGDQFSNYLLSTTEHQSYNKATKKKVGQL